MTLVLKVGEGLWARLGRAGKHCPLEPSAGSTALQPGFRPGGQGLASYRAKVSCF